MIYTELPVFTAFLFQANNRGPKLLSHDTSQKIELHAAQGGHKEAHCLPWQPDSLSLGPASQWHWMALAYNGERHGFVFHWLEA